MGCISIHDTHSQAQVGDSFSNHWFHWSSSGASSWFDHFVDISEVQKLSVQCQH